MYEKLTAIPPGGSLADAAYGQLSEAILRNELSPGTSLSVPELSRRLGISRSPVREAVLRLIHDGLADYQGRRGTYVSSIQMVDFVALLEVREVLEGLAARKAAERALPDELRVLDGLHQEFLALDPEGTEEEATFVELDMAFHSLIRSMAKNRELSDMLTKSQARAHLSMHSLWSGSRNVAAVQAEHSELCASILACDAERADAAARRHIRGLRQRVMDVGASARSPHQDVSSIDV